MIIELFFMATLNMSLPEFQPQEDISGNVIVSSIDDETKEVIAEEIPIDDISISDNESDRVGQGLSLEHDRTEEIIIPEVKLTRNDNVITIESSVLDDWMIYNDNTLGRHAGDNLYYIQLNAGVEYTLNNYGSNLKISFGLYNNAPVTSSTVGNTFTPSNDCYILKNNSSFYVTYISSGDVSGDEPGGDVSGGDVSGDEPGGDVSGDSPGGNISADLTNVEYKLDNVIVLQRSILMTLLVTFLFPIIKSCVNLLKGGKDV